MLVSDNDLIDRLAAGDERAFDELYGRYFTRLYNYAFQKTGDAYMTQEVVQELFIHLWQRRERLAISGVVSAYLFASARNLIIDQIRKETSRSCHADVFARHQPQATNQTEEQLRFDELHQTYERLLDQLPDKCRQVFSLSREGTSHRDIASQLSISEKTVEQHITRALRLLRQHMPGYLSFILALFG